MGSPVFGGLSPRLIHGQPAANQTRWRGLAVGKADLLSGIPAIAVACSRGSVASRPASPPFRPLMRTATGKRRGQHRAGTSACRSVAWWWVASRPPLCVPAGFRPKFSRGAKSAGRFWRMVASLPRVFLPLPSPAGKRGKKERRVSRGAGSAPAIRLSEAHQPVRSRHSAWPQAPARPARRSAHSSAIAYSHIAD